MKRTRFVLATALAASVFEKVGKSIFPKLNQSRPARSSAALSIACLEAVEELPEGIAVVE